MKRDVFHVLLLQALPASGKSEVRELMAHQDPEILRKEFHVGPNLQLDDFPYVFFMRRIDETLVSLGQPPIFYPGEEPFIDGRDWGTLSNLLNEDYHDLLNRTVTHADSIAKFMFKRIDCAAMIAGLPPRLAQLTDEVRDKLAELLEDEAKKLIANKESQYCESLDGKTIIIECSRGGSDGLTMPLTGTFGYQYALPNYCPEILENAAILYIWVTPEESRRKNRARCNPDDPGSNLNHMTPESVMLYDYGCDDMLYLKEISDVPDTVTVESHGRTYHLPIGVIDNREDLTTFLRGDAAGWDPVLLEKITRATREATAVMWERYNK